MNNKPMEVIAHEKSRKDLWCMVLAARAKRNGESIKQDIYHADVALEEFDKRFPTPIYNPLPDKSNP